MTTARLATRPNTRCKIRSLNELPKSITTKTAVSKDRPAVKASNDHRTKKSRPRSYHVTSPSHHPPHLELPTRCIAIILGQETASITPSVTMAANLSTDNAEQVTAPVANANGVQPSETTEVNANDAPAPPATEPRLPTRKDASLKEFLNKMDDYAPIVCIFLDTIQAYADENPPTDPRCSHQLLYDARGPPTAATDRPAPRAAASASNTEVYRRHCR